MGQVIMIASGKGGTGKTTAAANLGAAFSAKGKLTVLVDMDMGLRNLDVALGLESSVVYDFMDYLEGRCTIDEILLKADGYENLYFIASPQTRAVGDVDKEKLEEFWDILRNRFEFCIADSPAGISGGFTYIENAADTVIIVTLAETAAMRDADRVISLLGEKEDIRLIMNRVRPELIEKKLMMNMDECMDMLSIPIIGIVPEDESLLVSAFKGSPAVNDSQSTAGKAFTNVAARLCGEDIPIMEFRKKGFFDKLKELFEK